MLEFRALVAAAGRGTRAGLRYPKTLFQIQGKPILVRLVELLSVFDSNPTVVVSPEGQPMISQCLGSCGYEAHLVVQEEPRGMGDAVLCFEDSPAFKRADHVLLVWGDIPFIQPATLSALIKGHTERGNDFSFATRQVGSAYTIVSRDVKGAVMSIVETRELGVVHPQSGEREIGLFLFRKDPVFAALREDLPGKYGRTTSEHGFLYIVAHLVTRGLRVEALPIATELDLVSLNSMTDIDAYL
jgi:bifunctional UDP-N-acetylglucosamine pyrophosphorylase/glucosamine-1-phosphate N-acetyltransferase